MKLYLYCDNLLVGDITAPLYDQGTWFGGFSQRVVAQDGPLAHRVCDFITFCREWHGRLAAGATCEASEFDRFSDLLRSGRWSTRASDGTVARIEEAPVFVKAEVSWQVKPEERGMNGSRK